LQYDGIEEFLMLACRTKTKRDNSSQVRHVAYCSVASWE
jgi:hypothetical protein